MIAIRYPKNRSSKMSNFQSFKISKFQNFKASKFQISKSSKCQPFKIQSFQTCMVPKMQNSQLCKIEIFRNNICLQCFLFAQFFFQKWFGIFESINRGSDGCHKSRNHEIWSFRFLPWPHRTAYTFDMEQNNYTKLPGYLLIIVTIKKKNEFA